LPRPYLWHSLGTPLYASAHRVHFSYFYFRHRSSLNGHEHCYKHRRFFRNSPHHFLGLHVQLTHCIYKHHIVIYKLIIDCLFGTL
jgi:hypothetical protein